MESAQQLFSTDGGDGADEQDEMDASADDAYNEDGDDDEENDETLEQYVIDFFAESSTYLPLYTNQVSNFISSYIWSVL